MLTIITTVLLAVSQAHASRSLVDTPFTCQDGAKYEIYPADTYFREFGKVIGRNEPYALQAICSLRSKPVMCTSTLDALSQSIG